MSRRPLGSRAEIRAHQLAALGRLLPTVAAGNAFYGPILKQAGLAEPPQSLEDFFCRMPLTRKQALVDDQRLHPPYGTNLTFPLTHYSRYNQTSATSGAPLRWLDTHESWQWMLDNWKQVFQAAGVAATDCVYFAFSFGPFLGFWTAFEAACQMGCRCIPGGGVSSAGRLQAMAENEATVLACTPTYALRLAEVAGEEHVDLSTSTIRHIVVAGEPGGSVKAVRELIESAWPTARVFDHHGLTEVGPVCYQCPEKPCTLMVMESEFIAEILDWQTGLPVPPGELGELVLTNLGRVGSPLIRYHTSDLVREDVEIAGRFGRHELALEGGVLGRADDMVVVRGVNVYPAAIDDVLRSVPDVVEYRVEQHAPGAMAELHLHIEPAAECRDLVSLVQTIETRMRARFNLRMPVSLCPPGSLPRFEMKASRWVRR